MYVCVYIFIVPTLGMYMYTRMESWMDRYTCIYLFIGSSAD